MKRKIAILLTGMMLANTLTVCGSPTYTDAEIEKRIDEAGEEYIRFYRDGYNELYGTYGTTVAYGGAANTYNAAIDYETDEYETAAGEYDDGAAGIDWRGTANKSAMPEPEYVTEEAYEEEIAVEEAAYGLVPEAGEAYPGAPSGSDPFVIGDYNTEEWSPIEEAGFISVRTQPFSTFAADVDTASYSSLRRKLLEPLAYDERGWGDGEGIDNSAIRIEEMMNYFRYSYPEPEEGEKFGVTTTLNTCPWNEDALLLKVGIRAEEAPVDPRGSNIVFLIDTSGSMFDFDKLPLVKRSLEILMDKLGENDRISIVTYAGSEEVVLEGASGADRDRIMEAINSLEAWGSTWGEGGINRAYEIASKYYIENGNNRVILCTDGDFNVGVSSEAGLKDLISEKRNSGVFFSCLGFGEGNYSDTTMETLADNGNGNYFYIDCEREAERALSEEFFSTIYTVAKDTKFQIEFNPSRVKGYRLIGYENRKMAAEDFADDTKDGGEVGAGQVVTVLYEVIPVGSDYDIPEVASRYSGTVQETGAQETAESEDKEDISGSDAGAESVNSTESEAKTGTEAANSTESEAKTGTEAANSTENETKVEAAAEPTAVENSAVDDELLVVNLRWKEPDGEESVLREYPVSMADFSEEMDADTSWAAGVAQAGMVMRDSAYAGTTTLDDVYDRLKMDPEIMDNDFKAQFLYMLRVMKKNVTVQNP